MFGGFATVLAHPSVVTVEQLRPAPEIVPPPVPVSDAVSGYAFGSNLAATDFGPLTMIEQVDGPATVR